MAKLSYDDKTKMYFREGTSDSFILKEQRTYQPLIDMCKGMRVMDLGANIGAFSNNALRAKASSVVAWEPEPQNCKVLCKQPFCEKFDNFSLFERAVGSKEGEANFFINSKSNKGCHSLIERRGRDVITVKVDAFEDVMERYKPQILKVDIEGEELYLPWRAALESVQAIAIEIHFDKKGTIERARKLRAFLDKHFDEVTKESQSRVAEDKFMKLAFYIGVRK